MSHRDDLEERDDARAGLVEAPARTPERRGFRRRHAVIVAAVAVVAAGGFVLGARWWRGRASTESGGNRQVACEPEEARQARIARHQARARALPRLFGPTRAEPGPLVQELGVLGAAPIAGAEQRIAALREATT